VRRKPTVRKKATVVKKPGRTVPPGRHALKGAAEAEFAAFAEEVLKELRKLQAAVMPKTRRPRAADEGLESATNSIRRVLSDCFERDHESLLLDLIRARQELADPERRDPTAALRHLDGVIDRLGALEFSARPRDFVDPAIHEVRAERRVNGLPEGVVAESLRPGFRSRSGVVILKAWVAVNRRSGDESARD
jgi:hypothetical protein